MADLGNQGENLPVDGEALGALGAPIANPSTSQMPQNTIPLQESEGASSGASNLLTLTEFAKFMESFKSSMENSIKDLVGKEVDKKFASFSQIPSTSSTFFPNTILDVDGVKETPKHPSPNIAQLYNAAAPSYARAHVPMPHINHVGDPPPSES